MALSLLPGKNNVSKLVVKLLLVVIYPLSVRLTRDKYNNSKVVKLIYLISNSRAALLPPRMLFRRVYQRLIQNLTNDRLPAECAPPSCLAMVGRRFGQVRAFFLAVCDSVMMSGSARCAQICVVSMLDFAFFFLPFTSSGLCHWSKSTG